MTSAIAPPGRVDRARPTVAAYSARLWSAAPAGLCDGRLTRLLDAALARATDPDTRRAALDGWRRWRTLSTGQHVCPTYGPGFLAMARIASARAPAVPIVGAWSGIPFDNGAHPRFLRFASPLERLVRPGTATDRLTRAAMATRRRQTGATENRIALGHGRDRSRLVYGAPVPARLPDVLADLRPEARRLLAEPVGPDFTAWALRTADRVHGRALGRPVVSIDLNRLVADYLIDVIDDPGHAIGRLFHDRRWRARWCARLPDDPWFTATVPGAGGRSRMASVRCVGDAFVTGRRTSPVEPADVARGLAEGRLCPGLLLTFAVLVGIEGVRCLGGPRQAGYLARFAPAWRALGLPVPARPGPIDISGHVRDTGGAAVFPLDLALAGRTVDGLVPDAMTVDALRAPLTRTEADHDA